MILRYPFFVAVSVLAVSLSAQAADYKVDAGHSNVGFTVGHIMSKVKGQFKEFSGDFSFDAKKPAAATGKFVVKTASVSTNDEKRDAHLKNADFFDVEKFPEMTLEKIKVAPGKGKDKFKMTGDLTLHGVTKSVTFDLEFGGSAKDPWGNTRAGFSAKSKINRQDFGMKFSKVLDAGGLLVGNDVTIELEIEGIEQAAAESAKKE